MGRGQGPCRQSEPLGIREVSLETQARVCGIRFPAPGQGQRGSFQNPRCKMRRKRGKVPRPSPASKAKLTPPKGNPRPEQHFTHHGNPPPTRSWRPWLGRASWHRRSVSCPCGVPAGSLGLEAAHRRTAATPWRPGHPHAPGRCFLCLTTLQGARSVFADTPRPRPPLRLPSAAKSGYGRRESVASLVLTK